MTTDDDHFGLAGKRVLVVEDECFLAKKTVEAVRRFGGIVLGPVPDVEEAMEIVGRGAVDVAILDIRFGDGTSFPVADALRERGVRILFVTGYDDWFLLNDLDDVPIYKNPTDPDNVVRMLVDHRPKAEGRREIGLNRDLVRPSAREPKGPDMAKNTICIWYDKEAEAAARFYADVFPDSAVTNIQKAPGDYPSGRAGDVLTVEFTVAGIPCLGLNGGPIFKHTEAFSFQIATDDQAETDRYWNAIVGNGGEESACGWCRDRWGISWQITPRVLTAALAAGGEEAERAFQAMMTMRKIDVAAIEAARRG